jgi:hypothetical protein
MKKVLICILICFLAGKMIQAQQKVYMPFFEVVNLNQDYQYSLSELFQKYVKSEGKYEILLPGRKNETYPRENNETTQLKAKELGTPFFIKGNLNALGDLIIVNISMYSTEDGKEVWNAFLKASKIDDMDPILITCSKNLGEKNVTSTSNDIYTVTKQEGKELTEVETKICSGLLLGGLFTSGGFATGLGILTTYDNRTVIYGLDAGFFGHEDDMEAHIAITFDHPFSTSKNTAFAGGGIGLGMMSVYDNTDPMYNENMTKGGILLMGGGGFILNRSSSVRLIFGSRIVVPLFKVNDKFMPGVNFSIAVNISKKAKRKQTYDLNVNK